MFLCMAKSHTCTLDTAQRSVWPWEVQDPYMSFSLLQQNYFVLAFHRKIFPIPRVLHCTKPENPAKGLTKKCMGTTLINFICIMYLWTKCQAPNTSPSNSRHLIRSLRFQAISWNYYSYKSFSSCFLVAEGKVPASSLRTEAGEIGTVTTKLT